MPSSSIARALSTGVSLRVTVLLDNITRDALVNSSGLPHKTAIFFKQVAGIADTCKESKTSMDEKNSTGLLI
jgi:hypothetical protein